MEKKRILFISQEITPYLPKSEMSMVGRYLPQGMQEKKREIRTFMPRYGLINERRNQLHEVIRLSGMNLIIDGTDHPLIIKVASIQSARMQVYFIDNEDFFHRKAMFTDKEGKLFEDNDERSIFFSRGALETVRKLRWSPDIVHCNGWMSAIAATYVKKALKNDPLFQKTKVIYSVYNDDFEGTLNPDFAKKSKFGGMTKRNTDLIEKTPNYINLNKLGIKFSDGIIYGSEKINPELDAFIKKGRKKVLPYQNPEDYINSYSDFYDKLLS